nr:dynein light chain, cytoplasmic-like [Tanacetum cinerariifolium]
MEKPNRKWTEKQFIKLSNDRKNPPPEDVKLAAVAVSLNIRLRSADMPSVMQERALRLARELMDSSTSRRPNLTIMARSIKKEFDQLYGPAWHCVAGKSFGSFVTHSPGGFVYFSVDAYSFLLFKTEVQVITEDPPPPCRRTEPEGVPQVSGTPMEFFDLDESTVQPVGFRKPEMMTNTDSQMMAADLPFDIQKIEGASKLQDTIATEICNDYVHDFPVTEA